MLGRIALLGIKRIDNCGRVVIRIVPNKRRRGEVFPERLKMRQYGIAGAAGKPSGMLQMKIDSQCPERASWVYCGRRFRGQKGKSGLKEVGEDGR